MLVASKQALKAWHDSGTGGCAGLRPRTCRDRSVSRNQETCGRPLRRGRGPGGRPESRQALYAVAKQLSHQPERVRPVPETGGPMRTYFERQGASRVKTCPFSQRKPAASALRLPRLIREAKIILPERSLAGGGQEDGADEAAEEEFRHAAMIDSHGNDIFARPQHLVYVDSERFSRLARLAPTSRPLTYTVASPSTSMKKSSGAVKRSATSRRQRYQRTVWRSGRPWAVSVLENVATSGQAESSKSAW